MRVAYNKVLGAFFAAFGALAVQAKTVDLPFRSSLPILRVHTDAGFAIGDDAAPARLEVLNVPQAPAEISSSDPAVENLEITIQVRGSTSRMFPKKQYGVKTKQPVSLLGLPPGKDFTFNAIFRDKALLRDSMAYELGRSLGRFAPRTQYFELIVNGEYRGVYLLIERITPERAGIPDWHDGGTLLEWAGWMDGKEEAIKTRHGSLLQVIFPSWKKLSAEEKAQFQAKVLPTLDNFESALYDKKWKGAEPESFIDLASFADFFVIQELFNNIDGYRRSLFIHLNAEGRIVAGPIWDFDQAAANMTLNDAPKYKGWRVEHKGDPIFPVLSWWRLLLKRPALREAVIARWRQLRQPGAPFASANLERMINERSQLLIDSGAVGRNFARWDILGVPDRLLYFIIDPAPWPNTYEGEVEFLREWILQRAAWIDNNIDAMRRN